MNSLQVGANAELDIRIPGWDNKFHVGTFLPTRAYDRCTLYYG
jgi:hypothetical protein